MASINFNDLIALIRLAVQSSTATHAALGGKTLNEAIGGRVVGAALLDADAQTIQLPAIVLDLFGGGAEYSFALEADTVYVYAYSDESQGAATDLYEAFVSVLQGTRLYDPDGHIGGAGYAYEQSRPISGPNEKLKSWFARGVWLARLAG